MITFTCDRCERKIELDDSYAGSKYECPDCGDFNAVPDVARHGSDRAVAAGYPPDSGPEQPVIHVRPAMFRAHPLAFILHLLALIGGIVGWVWFGPIMSRSPHWLSWLMILIVVGASIGLTIWKIKTLALSLEITTKRSIQRTGLFSKATSEVLHDNIRNIQIRQSFVDRIFRVGAIAISSAGQEGIEIEIDDIPNPNKLREIVDLYRPIG